MKTKKQTSKSKSNAVQTTSSSSSSSTNTALPIGSIVAFCLSSNAIPTGWLLCDGSTIDSLRYPDAANMGITNTPNLAGLTLLGSGGKYELNNKGGEETVKLTVDQIPPHTHPISYYYWHTVTGGGTGDASNLDGSGAKAYTDSAGGDSTGESKSHNNMQPYYVVNYIMYIGQPIS